MTCDNWNGVIFNENCFDRFAIMHDLSIDHVFTSPPYNRKRNDKYTHYTDIIDDYYGMLCRLIDESIRVSRGFVFINIQKNYYNSSDVYRIFGKYHDKIKEVFVWEKSNPLPASGNSITNSFEYIIVLSGGDTSLKSKTTYTKNHITTSVAKMPKEHKAVMHYDIAKFFADKFFNTGDIVYDPFLGTGTTAVACEQVGGVVWFGSEISEEYCDMARTRINNSRATTVNNCITDLFD